MATSEAAAPDSPDNHDHGDHGHDHPSWLAHHFDTPEQQFDSGKLGIWIFLVTEILFFGGMFCAYAIFRALRPEVFEGCSQFLNTNLGAINTGVLLFSSLTMAWAVRCAQTEEHKKLVVMITLTLCCAMIFLGVKAIEYSHKWTIGLLPAGMYFYDPANPHPEPTTNYLAYICAPVVALTIGCVVWAAISFIRKDALQKKASVLLTIVCLSFFGGVQLGTFLEGGDHHDSEATVSHVDGHDGEEHGDADHVGQGHADHDGHDHEGDHDESGHAEVAADTDLGVIERLAENESNSGLKAELLARQAQVSHGTGAVMGDDGEYAEPIVGTESDVLIARQAGLFFGIYYCMTGVHAIHIIGGIGVLVWLLIRAIRQDFNKQYFGPVDYIGLYWHLVDLIWIYLFPLLYLIR